MFCHLPSQITCNHLSVVNSYTLCLYNVFFGNTSVSSCISVGKPWLLILTMFLIAINVNNVVFASNRRLPTMKYTMDLIWLEPKVYDVVAWRPLCWGMRAWVPAVTCAYITRSFNSKALASPSSFFCQTVVTDVFQTALLPYRRVIISLENDWGNFEGFEWLLVVERLIHLSR